MLVHTSHHRKSIVCDRMSCTGTFTWQRCAKRRTPLAIIGKADLRSAQEALMSEPSFGRKVQVLAGFCVSFAGLFWLISVPYKPPLIVPRIGYVCAIFCTFGCALSCWAAGYAYLVRKLNWSPRSCRWAGLSFVLPTLVLYFASGQSSSYGPLVCSQMILGAYLCRRFAFPNVTDEQAFGPEPPLSLFPR